MDQLETRRHNETLAKEKSMRRGWKAHAEQQQVFEPSSDAMGQLLRTREALVDLDEPAGDNVPSRRQQLVQLRNHLRSSLQDVDAALKE